MTQVVQNFLTMALWGSVASLAVLAVRPLIKKSSNRILCLLWVVVMFRFLCPFTVEGPIPAFWSAGVQKEAVPVALNESVDVLQGSADVADSEQIHQGSDITLVNTQTNPSESARAIQATGVENTVKNESEASPISSGENYLSVSASFSESNQVIDTTAIAENYEKADITVQSLLSILGVIWLIGTILLLAFGVERYISIYRALKEAIRIKEWKKYPVMVSDVSGVPMSFGIFHPGIYVPVSFDESVKIYDRDGQEKKPVFTDKQKEMILWHETMHLRHLDPLWKVVSFVMVAIHWWNPLAWISVRCMNQDLEMACDEAVLAQIGQKERGEYANTLLGFAAKQSGLSLVAAFGESHAESRIKNALKYRKSPLWVSALTLILVLGFAGCLATNPTEKKEDGQAEMETAVGQEDIAAQYDEAESESSEKSMTEDSNDAEEATVTEESNNVDEVAVVDNTKVGMEGKSEEKTGRTLSMSKYVEESDFIKKKNVKIFMYYDIEDTSADECIHVPYINIDSDEAREANQEIEKIAEKLYNEFGGHWSDEEHVGYITTMDYICCDNGDSVSLLISYAVKQSGSDGLSSLYKAYNIKVDGTSSKTDDGKIGSFSKDEIRDRVNEYYLNENPADYNPLPEAVDGEYFIYHNTVYQVCTGGYTSNGHGEAFDDTLFCVEDEKQVNYSDIVDIISGKASTGP